MSCSMIPMEELEGRMSAAAHTQLVQTAVDGGMNTLRVVSVRAQSRQSHDVPCIVVSCLTAF
eukprot:SAG11_NODE_972_length_6340_cov_3.043423_6_plen_62_part_00